ncbi:MAG: hypothetical protein JWM72_4727 [Actinomycetia bacterium]|nr:hypothetical protein [Actinomycetes bacterium]
MDDALIGTDRQLWHCHCGMIDGVRWFVGLFGIAVFAALGVAAAVTRSPGPLVPVAAVGIFALIVFLRHPETSEREEPGPKRGMSAAGVCAWMLGVGGLAACVMSVLADVDVLLLVGAFACLASAGIGAAAVERRLPSSFPQTWWGLGRRALTRRPQDPE